MTDMKVHRAYQKKVFTLEEVRSWSVIHLDLPIRAYNVLKREGVETIGKLIDLEIDDLFDMRGMGPKSVKQIVLALHDLKDFGHDLELKDWRLAWEKRPWFVNA